MTLGERGSALVWALLATMVFATASALVAESLMRRASVVRRSVARAHREDLDAAAQALLKARERDAPFTGPETVSLSGGTITLRRDATGRVVAEVAAGATSGSSRSGR